jgi:hypothetical protein
MYTIHEIANRLTELVSEQKFVEAYVQLYADDAESIDPLNTDQQELKSLQVLVEREESFLSRTTIHKINVSEPLIAGSYFTVNLTMDFTVTGLERRTIEELCVYKVKDGKIILQQFFIG